jgi:hypothetical protein
MNTVHTYALDKDTDVKNYIERSGKDNFNIRLAMHSGDSRNFHGDKELSVGNVQLPIEDICELIDNFDNQIINYSPVLNKSILSRILFIYGTAFSQRENCIIGKLSVEILYSKEPIAEDLSMQNVFGGGAKAESELFLHKETYVNRKIPLQGVLNAAVGNISGLRDALDTLEYIAKINGNIGDLEESGSSPSKKEESRKASSNVQTHRTGADMGTGRVGTHRTGAGQEQTMLSGMNKYQLGAKGAMTLGKDARKDQTEKRRTLVNLLRNGLNVGVVISPFEEDQELKKKLGEKYSRVIYNTLSPAFNQHLDWLLKMDTSLFDYMKTKNAVMEVRHYIQ